MEEKFRRTFEKLKPIVLNARKKYRIKLWQLDDYLQEGMIVLHQLLKKGHDERKLPVYFKVKFSQHLIDAIRSQQALRRTYDSADYIDIHEHDYMVADSRYQADRELICASTQSAFFATLREHERQLFKDLLEGKKVDRMRKHRLKQRLIQFLKENDDI